jgi:hypothetical protein
MNSKAKGDIAVGQAISHYISNGYEVCLPIGDKRHYDVIVEKDGFIKRVQIKYGYYVEKKGRSVVGLRITGGNQSFNYAKKYTNDAFDELFVYTEKGNKYAFPWKDISCRNELAVDIPKYKGYKV